MATSTTNLGLTKPAGTDKIRIAQINGNMDILDEKIGAVGNTSLQAQVTSQNQAIANNEGAMAYIVGNTNTTGSTLAVGQFVYVKGHSTIAEGLRTVTASISENGNITTSNTSACSEGGLNALNGKITPIQDIISQKQLKSGSPIIINESAQNKFSFLIIGYLQAVGPVFLSVTYNGGSVNVTDILTGNAFSNSNYTFTFSNNAITIATSLSYTSYITVICGNGLVN